jgi:putative oxidoreductase
VNWLERHRDVGALFIRLAVGYRLVYGTADNVFSHERMVEFAGFLEQHGFPFPMVGAVVSAYAQVICGTLFIFGAATRLAGAIMVVNFLFALAIAHRGTPYLENFPALMMLAAGAFFLFNGAGRPSVDDWWAQKRVR